jgi:uncharacterized protein YdeI (YjbR/CyaY-like superfamily)
MNSRSKVSGKSALKKTSAKKPTQIKAREARLFRNQSAWSAWLEKNHERSSGIWLRLAKKNSRLQSVTYAEALDVALCYGWIDG